MTEPTYSPLAEVQDPQTSAERLAQLANAHAGLRPLIASHPNSYPALREWIAATERAASAVPATPTGATDPGWVPAAQAPERRPRRRGLIIGLSAGVAAVLVVAGGGAWWFFASRLGGASSPEAAAEKLIAGASAFDPLSMYGSLAPSEVSLLRDPLERLANATSTADDVETVDAQEFLASLRSELKITSRDLAFESEELAEGVARVTWTGGEISIDGDERAVADVLIDAYEPTLRSSLESSLDPSEIDAAIADARESITSGMDLPHTIRANDAGSPLAVVTVDEGGWFISPALSFADAAYRSSDAAEDPAFALGDEIVEAATFDSPEAAATGLIDAALSGDVDDLAAALPLAERRLLSIYGTPIAESAGYGAGWPTGIDITTADLSAQIDGDTARVSIDELAWSATSYDEAVGADLTDVYSLSGTCMTWTDQYAWDDGWWSDDASWWDSGEWVENYVVDETSGDGCLEDQTGIGSLGLEDAAVIAVKENGGWLVSPTATIADATALMTDRILEYYEDGRLDELLSEAGA